MVGLSLIVSAVLSPAAFCHDQSLCRAPKELLLGHCRQDILISASMPGSDHFLKGNWQPKDQCAGCELQRLQTPSTVLGKPLLLDIQDIRPDLVLFSFGIAEQCARREKMIKLLFSRLNSEDDIDTPLLGDLMGLKSLAVDPWPEMHAPLRNDILCPFEGGSSSSEHFLITNRQIHVPSSLLDFVGNCSSVSHSAAHPDGQILIARSESTIDDVFSVTSESNQLKSFTSSSKQMMVVPYFTRSRGGHVKAKSQGPVITDLTTAPSGSPETTKLKSQRKKQNKNKKALAERDLYQKNYLLACESLLSAFLNKDNKGTNKVLLSLKKSQPELAKLLSQFAAGIAGSGIAILFSVASEAASRKAPLATAKLLNTALGFGFLWLSWAINRLHDTITDASRNSSKHRLTDVDIVERIESKVKDVLLRVAGLAVIAMLKFV